MIDVIVLQALFALGFIVTKKSLVYTPPLTLVGLRMALGGALLLGYYGFTYYCNPSGVCPLPAGQRIRALWLLGAAALCNIYLTNVLEFWGLQYITAAQTAFIYSFSPFIAALAGYFFFGEHLGRMRWLGLALGCIGFTGLIVPDVLAQGANGTSMTLYAQMAIVCASIATVFGWLSVKELVRAGVPVLVVNGLTMFIAGLAALGTGLATETARASSLLGELSFACVGYHALGIIIYCIICYNLYAFLLKRYTATFMCFAGFMTPLFTTVLGWFLLGESVQAFFFVALGLIFAGIYIFHREESA